jgi:hypothetical protein
MSTPQLPIPALFAGSKDPIGMDVCHNDDDDVSISPLRNKKTVPNVGALATTAKGRVFHPPDPKRYTAMEKGKGKAEAVVRQSRPRTVVVGEKENDAKRAKLSSGVVGAVGTSVRVSGGSGSANEGKGAKTAGKSVVAGKSKTRLMSRLPSGKAGGPRRVPVDSAEAGVTSAKGRRG